MDFKTASIITRIIFLVFLISSCSQSEFIEYRPLYLSDEGSNEHIKSYGSSKLDSSELKNIVQVLEYYEQEYKITPDNKVLIKKELNNDWELVWNFTSKSEDTSWLRTHQPDKKLHPTTKAKNH